MNKTFVLSPNLIKDKAFTSSRVLREPAWEINEIVKNALRQPEQQSFHESSASLDSENTRNELNISLKVFLKDCDTEKAKEAIERILNILGTEYVEELNLALPEITSSILGFTSETLDPALLEENKAKLLGLWRFFEKLVDRKVIKNLGISDCETEVFKYLYDNAKVKPTSVQINQTTCCVVPPELNAFANENKILLLTHSDPNIIWNPRDECLKHLKLRWIIKSVIQVEKTAVLMDKRYAINLV